MPHKINCQFPVRNLRDAVLANIYTVQREDYDSPEQALERFQMRERGDSLANQMDRANNILGNTIALELGMPTRNMVNIGNVIRRLQEAEYHWIEIDKNGKESLVTGKYPAGRTINGKRMPQINQLRSFLEANLLNN